MCQLPACSYGWFVMVVEMLGATATMLYGLNIIMDPVHEPLEMEPDAPGITKVSDASCLSTSSDLQDRLLSSTGWAFAPWFWYLL